MLAAAQPRTKSPEAFRTISEVSEALDVPQHVLRFWEGRFSQIRPVKRAGGRRYYRPEDVDLLRGIRSLLYSDGYTIRGVQKILRDKGSRFVTEIGRGEARANLVVVTEAFREKVEMSSDVPETDEIADAIAAEAVEEPTHARAAIALVERAHHEVFGEPESEDIFAKPLIEAKPLAEATEFTSEATTVEAEDASSVEELSLFDVVAPLAETAVEKTIVEPEADAALSDEQRAKLEVVLADLLNLKTRLVSARH
ncbi:MAG TPA: MerR family transcriptional regulator [Rhizomicrobium sp.]|nr:MerR family transcriptional regulator [Rhizomicrobium sp.]